MTLEPGALYLLRGGHLVRYQGPHSGWGPNEVIRKLSTDDARGLRVRYVQLLVRKMKAEAEWIRDIMAELGISLPILPPSLR